VFFTEVFEPVLAITAFQASIRLSTYTRTISNLEFGYFVTNTGDFPNDFVTNNTRVVARSNKVKGKKKVRNYATTSIGIPF
jgi:hypothetical protein